MTYSLCVKIICLKHGKNQEIPTKNRKKHKQKKKDRKREWRYRKTLIHKIEAGNY